jgi:hypothetical protein
MNLKEIDQVKNKISDLKGNEKIRAKIKGSGESKPTIFVVYKNTFSERSLHKLEKLKNIFINKKLSENSSLTKGILDKNSITAEEVKIFIEGKNAAIQKNLADEMKKLEDEFGLKDITIEDLRNDEEIKTKTEINNPEKFEENFLDGELLNNINELEKLEFYPEDMKPTEEPHSEVDGTNSNKLGAAAVAELDKMLNELEGLKDGVEYTPTKINIGERPTEVNPNLSRELDKIRDMKSNFAEMGLYAYEPKGYQYKKEVLKSEPRNGISKNKSNSIKEELKNLKNALQEKIGLNKNIQPPELTTNKKVSFKEESITDTQNIKKDINAKELANDFSEITLTKGVTDGIAISTALRTKLIKNKNNLELTISAETMGSTILKFKSIVINLLHDKNSILKNLSLEDRNLLSLHYDILPAQIQKDLVKLHPSILEDKVSAQEDKSDSTSI